MQDGLGFGLAALFWVVIWCFAAALVANDILLAGPLATLESLFSSILKESFWEATASTSLRIICTAAISALIGISIGLIASASRHVRMLMAPLLQVMKSAPIACVIVIILVASGAQGALVAIVAFVALPPFYIAAIESQQERDHATEDVLRLAGISRLRIFLAVIWPIMRPYFTVAAKTAVALSWRAGITAELFCIPFGSIGEGVYLSKLTLDSASLLMWTIVVMVLSWVNEKLVVALLNFTRHSSRWAILRGKPTLDGANVNDASLRLTSISFSYGDQPVLEHINLVVEQHERVCLMAPTGTGKSTLVDVLLGRNAPQKGIVSRPEHIGVVLQNSTLIDTLTAQENIELFCGPLRLFHTSDELVELLPEGSLDKLASDLSGGTRRLIEIARAVLGSNRAIVLDEPFAGLDREAKECAYSFIMNHLASRPLLVVTHDSHDAELLYATIIEL